MRYGFNSKFEEQTSYDNVVLYVMLYDTTIKSQGGSCIHYHDDT